MTDVGTAVVALAGATKRYGDTVALRDVDLRIEPGEFVAVLGPNGAGKTTAIKLILGLRRPTAGRVLLFGRPPSDRAARARCGVMLQESGVPGMLTVRETIELFSSHYAAPLPLARVLAFARLEAKRDTRAHALSGGERQRLYYGIAVCGDPEVLFLDEPTVGLDVQVRHALLDDIASFAAAGKTIVLTTHYLEEADRLARRVIVVDRGRVIADASPAQLKAALPGKRLRFTTDRELAPADFQGLATQALRLEDRRVQLLTDDPARVIAALANRGLPLRDLEVTGADLEEAFLVLTGSETRR